MADYSKRTIHQILDSVPMCHVAYVHDGRAHCRPTLQWREGDTVYWHGSSASDAIAAASGSEVCLSVSELDGLVVARSAFHFSVNYRACIIYGSAQPVKDRDEKLRILRMLVDRFVPGHWDALRPISDQELKATSILSMPIHEASAKVRSGPPNDPEEDYGFPVWAGHVPFVRKVLKPESDIRIAAGIDPPPSLADLRFD